MEQSPNSSTANNAVILKFCNKTKPYFCENRISWKLNTVGLIRIVYLATITITQLPCVSLMTEIYYLYQFVKSYTYS